LKRLDAQLENINSKLKYYEKIKDLKDINILKSFMDNTLSALKTLPSSRLFKKNIDKKAWTAAISKLTIPTADLSKLTTLKPNPTVLKAEDFSNKSLSDLQKLYHSPCENHIKSLTNIISNKTPENIYNQLTKASAIDSDLQKKIDAFKNQINPILEFPLLSDANYKIYKEEFLNKVNEQK